MPQLVKCSHVRDTFLGRHKASKELSDAGKVLPVYERIFALYVDDCTWFRVPPASYMVSYSRFRPGRCKLQAKASLERSSADSDECATILISAGREAQITVRRKLLNAF